MIPTAQHCSSTAAAVGAEGAGDPVGLANLDDGHGQSTRRQLSTGPAWEIVAHLSDDLVGFGFGLGFSHGLLINERAAQTVQTVRPWMARSVATGEAQTRGRQRKDVDEPTPQTAGACGSLKASRSILDAACLCAQGLSRPMGGRTRWPSRAMRPRWGRLERIP